MKLLTLASVLALTSASASASPIKRTPSAAKCSCDALVAAYAAGANGSTGDLEAPALNATDDAKHTKFFLVKGTKNFMVQVKNGDCSLVDVHDVRLCGGDVCAD